MKNGAFSGRILADEYRDRLDWNRYQLSKGAGQNRYLFDFPLIFCLMMSNE
jgi:hypothetical protein